MKRLPVLIVLSLLAVVIVIVLLTAALTPENSNPAFAVAVQFVQAAGTGDDATALALLAPAMQAYITDNCPDGQVSACIQPYTPPEWGSFQSVVFRRATPEGAHIWHVDLIATYAEDKGFSGVCIYNRVERNDSGDWLVAEWAGFIHCGEAASRNMATNPDTPNRVTGTG
jgi:hypothetical protein